MKLREMILGAFFAAILFVQQVIFSGLPNIHLCAVLIIFYTLYFPKLALPATMVFILLEGIFYPINLWWISYLYVWPLLILLTFLFRKVRAWLFWAVLGGLFGLFFGLLCSIPYLFIGGVSAMFAYFINGIPYDIAHGIGNFCVIMLFWKPMERLFRFLQKHFA